MNKTGLKWVKTIFFTGLFSILPVTITISLVFWFFNKIDLIFRYPIEKYFGQRIYGLGFIITILLILITGVFVTNIIGKRIFHWLEKFFFKIPLVGIIYSSVKQIIDSLNFKQKNDFQACVLVKYPSKGIYALGFLTSKNSIFKEDLIDEEMVTVFVPTTPNPTSGMLIIVPKNEIIKVDMSIEDAIKFIVSAGILYQKKEKFSEGSN